MSEKCGISIINAAVSCLTVNYGHFVIIIIISV